jgi:diguanylate cyclase (GGDEF)-like protein/PAS domain S-box-containing protein
MAGRDPRVTIPPTARYAGITIAAAGVLLGFDLAALPAWPHPWAPLVLVVLLALCVGAVHLQFQVHSGWFSDAGTVPHLATALLLPPGLAVLVAGIGLLTFGVTRRRPWLKVLFNTASGMLAVGAAAHVSATFGGPPMLTHPEDWPVALLASGTYFLVSTATVAGVVALDQGRSFRHALGARLGPKALTDIGLGLLGATLALVITTAPLLAPALVIPGVLLFLANQVMDRATRRSHNLSVSSRVGQAVARTLRPEHAFRAILEREVRDTLKLDGLALMPLGDTSAFIEQVACDLDQPDLRAALVKRVAGDPRAVVVDANGRAAPAWLPPELRALGVTGGAFPCAVGGEHPTGVLVAWRGTGVARPRPFDAEEVLLLETLADYAAVAVETLGGRLAAEERAARVRAIMDSVADGLLTIDEQGRIESCNPAAEGIFGCGADELVGQPVALFLPSAIWHIQSSCPDPATSVPSSGRGNEREYQQVAALRRDGTQVPVELALSELQLGDRRLLIAATRDITERKKFEAKLHHLAFHDQLSNLPNRALFLERLQYALARAGRRGGQVAVLLLDMDNLKLINDSLGHDAGDQVLLTMADRLRASLRAEDTAARFGGDEFAVLLEVSNLTDATSAAVLIADRLRPPIRLNGHEMSLTASIGIALGTPGEDAPENLVRQADLAMYKAKTSGKARYAVFDQTMTDQALARLELESDLRRGLERSEFRVYYQPIVSLASNRIVELEALVRWEHPERGLISPIEFIPVAEETGLILQLGQWVLEEACRQAVVFQVAYPGEALTMGVNLSVRQFQRPQLLADIRKVLETTGLDPGHLKLEITESVIMQDAEATTATLVALKNLGVRLAIDDFGTGYSSLSYLKRFPVDTLKIDRAFVEGLGRDDQDTAIVRSIVALAKALGLSVTGEGVETGAQRALLKKLGCDRAQGYLESRPITAASLGVLLENQQGLSAIAA